MNYFLVQYALVMICGVICMWRIYMPYDTIARIAFGAAIGFWTSIWTGVLLLK